MQCLLLLLLLALLLPLSAHAQHAPLAPLHHGRPSFATSGTETIPMMSIDEAALGRGRFAEIPFPPEHWQEMVRCVASLGLQVHLAGSPPAVILVPVACTIRVHDLTLDSLLYAEDSTYFGEHWNSPTVGYALVRSNVILATEPYRQNKYLLRHEALHHLVWRIRRQMGHPEYVFGPCDKRYGG